MRDYPIYGTVEDACACVGIYPRKMHGRFTITNTVDGRKNDGAGRIRFFNDGQGGIAFNWRTGARAIFFYDYKTGKTYTPKELKEFQARYEARMLEDERRQKQLHCEASKLAESLMQVSCVASERYPYLVKKGIPFSAEQLRTVNKYETQARINKANLPHEDGTNQKVLGMAGDELLFIPLVDKNRSIVSAQFIDSIGHKKFLKGGQAKGSIWLGSAENLNREYMGEIGICEGVATAVSVAKVQGIPVIAGLNAGNLCEATKTVKKLFPIAPLSIFADNDANGAGLKGAEKAKEAIPSLAIFKPTFDKADKLRYRRLTGKDKAPTDFNDLYIVKGAL